MSKKVTFGHIKSGVEFHFFNPTEEVTEVYSKRENGEILGHCAKCNKKMYMNAVLVHNPNMPLPHYYPSSFCDCEEIEVYVHRQGMGKVRAKPVHMFEVGELIQWNHGFKAEFIRVIKESPKTLLVETKSLCNGKHYERRVNKNTLWGIG